MHNTKTTTTTKIQKCNIKYYNIAKYKNTKLQKLKIYKNKKCNIKNTTNYTKYKIYRKLYIVI